MAWVAARYIDIAKEVARLESSVTELGTLLQTESHCISDMLTVLRSGVIPGSQTTEDRGYTLSDVQGLDVSRSGLVCVRVRVCVRVCVIQLRHYHPCC